jgi:hypothetical protein
LSLCRIEIEDGGIRWLPRVDVEHVLQTGGYRRADILVVTISIKTSEARTFVDHEADCPLKCTAVDKVYKYTEGS